jgi:hypothetical protein
MNNSFYFRLWLSFRIWMIALLVNTAIGALYLGGFSHHFGTFWEYVVLGICWGSVFSLPIMLTVLYTLGNCIYAGKTGKEILLTIFLWVFLVTALMFFLFCVVLAIGIPSILAVLFGIALVSGSIGIGFHYRSLLKCGTDYQQ